jgi:hypothetical protein
VLGSVDFSSSGLWVEQLYEDDLEVIKLEPEVKKTKYEVWLAQVLQSCFKNRKDPLKASAIAHFRAQLNEIILADEEGVLEATLD